MLERWEDCGHARRWSYCIRACALRLNKYLQQLTHQGSSPDGNGARSSPYYCNMDALEFRNLVLGSSVSLPCAVCYSKEIPEARYTKVHSSSVASVTRMPADLAKYVCESVFLMFYIARRNYPPRIPTCAHVGTSCAFHFPPVRRCFHTSDVLTMRESP